MTGRRTLLDAWVDESMREGDSGGDYILAAVLSDPDVCDPVRDQLRSLRIGRQARIHWHTEDHRRRGVLAAAVAEIDLASIVIVGSPLQRARQERARRKCLQRLLHELDQRGVDQVWTESRTERLNKRDLHLVEALRGQGSISKRLRVGPARPAEEPMLWASDIVAGIVAAGRGGADEWLALLRPRMTEICIDTS